MNYIVKKNPSQMQQRTAFFIADDQFGKNSLFFFLHQSRMSTLIVFMMYIVGFAVTLHNHR